MRNLKFLMERSSTGRENADGHTLFFIPTSPIADRTVQIWYVVSVLSCTIKQFSKFFYMFVVFPAYLIATSFLVANCVDHEGMVI